LKSWYFISQGQEKLFYHFRNVMCSLFCVISLTTFCIRVWKLHAFSFNQYLVCKKKNETRRNVSCIV